MFKQNRYQGIKNIKTCISTRSETCIYYVFKRASEQKRASSGIFYASECASRIVILINVH